MKKVNISVLLILIFVIVFAVLGSLERSSIAVENKEKQYKGTINTELYSIGVIQSSRGRNYISGKIYIAEWTEGKCLTPSTLPKITLKSTDGKYSKATYIDYLSGIEYYFDIDVEDIDTEKEYYLEVELTNPNNQASKLEQTQRAKISPKGQVGKETNGKVVKVLDNNVIKFENTSGYKGTINTELYKIGVIQSSRGRNYISGKIYIAEWTEGKCLTPSTLPKITLKSTDGKYSKATYIDYLSGIEYYFDIDVEDIDTEKEYYLEVELTNPNNQASKLEQTQRAKISPKGQVGKETNGKVVKVLDNNVIKFENTSGYKGTINTELYKIGVIQSSKGRNYISGKIYIAEWTEGKCLTPSMLPKITLKSTDGQYSEVTYIDYLSGIEYYFDIDIENINIEKQYYLEVELTNPNNQASKAEQTQRAKINQRGIIGKCTNGKNVLVIDNNILKLEKRSGIDIDTSKYPGYKEALEKLQSAHPNWNFELLYTGVKFSDAVAGEYKVRKRNLVPTDYGGEWIAGTTLYDTGWYAASEKAIAYYMDPRNFLNDTDIFQFQDVNDYLDGVCTLEGIKNKVSGSFLQEYATDINTACKNKNVNPYYIIARLFQENGTNPKNGTYKMNGGDNKYYYNPFNIGATGDTKTEVYNNALARAKQEGWDTMEKALEGGIYFCKANWLDNYQNTLYQNRFDIDTRNGTALYTHQYMQNLMGAYSEARILRSSYANTGKLESEFTFIIPLYEGMEATLSPMPVNSQESYSINVKTTGTYVRIRSDASTDSTILRELPTKGTILLSVQRGINSNWQKVITSDGLIGYISGDYVTQIDDVTTCNYTANVKTNDGDGCNVRIGPSTRLDKVTALSDGVSVTVIDDSTYKNIDGYDWSRVRLSSGTQVFMPSKYLVRQ